MLIRYVAERSVLARRLFWRLREGTYSLAAAAGSTIRLFISGFASQRIVHVAVAEDDAGFRSPPH